MSYLSLQFIILALVTLIVYYTWPKKAGRYQYLVILTASLIFFGFYNVLYFVYILTTIITIYITGLLINKCSTIDNRKPTSKSKAIYCTTAFYLCIVINTSLLAISKYLNPLIVFINMFSSNNFDLLTLVVPLGISFYTFTAISYIVDVKKNLIKAEKNIVKLSYYLLYFPKLLSGPITKYDKFVDNGFFDYHSISKIDVSTNSRRFIIGLVKKVVIADVLSPINAYVWKNMATTNWLVLVITAIIYSIIIYADFSGLMDMSVGFSGLLGIDLPENFNTPYLSRTISEFWKRWHITLGSWLRDYIYIPLGGNKVSKWRWAINIMVVWIISGIWHGANSNFVIWGAYYGLLLVLSKLFEKHLHIKNDSPVIAFFRVIRTFALVTAGWVLFQAPTLINAFEYYKAAICFWNSPSFTFDFLTKTEIPFWLYGVCLSMITVLIIRYFFLRKAIKTNMQSTTSDSGDIVYDCEISKATNSRKSFLVRVQQFCKPISINAVYIFVFSMSIFVHIYLGGLGGATSSFIYFNF